MYDNFSLVGMQVEIKEDIPVSVGLHQVRKGSILKITSIPSDNSKYYKLQSEHNNTICLRKVDFNKYCKLIPRENNYEQE